MLKVITISILVSKVKIDFLILLIKLTLDIHSWSSLRFKVDENKLEYQKSPALRALICTINI